MEARLFFISLWCGLYGRVLRFVFQNDAIRHKMWVILVFNSLFWGTVGVILGMLKMSYSTVDQFTLPQFVQFFAMGAVYGLVMGWLQGQSKRIFNSVVWAVLGLGFGWLLSQGKSGFVAFLYPAGLALGAAISSYTMIKPTDTREEMLRDNLEWGDTGFSAILLASIVMFFIIQAFKIPSGSMRMTFVEGDHLFVNKFIYGVPIPFTDRKVFPLSSVQSEDVVIFRFPSDEKDNPHHGKDFIKRVVALEGQSVQIVDKKLMVDGQVLDEAYKQHVDEGIYIPSFKMEPDVFQTQWERGEFAGAVGNSIRDNFGPVVVPKDHVMVMGDNRDRSFDSRFWGPLPLSAIKGKAWLLYWPLPRFRVVHKE